MKWKNLFFATLTTLITITTFADNKGNGDVGSVGANAWECSQKSGLGGEQLHKVRLEKQKDGTYSVYITSSAGDVGPQWHLDDVKLSGNLTCKFTKTNPHALYCVSQDEKGWTTVTSSLVQIQGLDQATGDDFNRQYTNVIVSSSSDLMKNFNNSVFIVQASSCLVK